MRECVGVCRAISVRRKLTASVGEQKHRFLTCFSTLMICQCHRCVSSTPRLKSGRTIISLLMRWRKPILCRFSYRTRTKLAELQNEDSLDALLPLADRLHDFREKRNEVVHDVATELGRQRRALANSAAPEPADENYSYEEVKAGQRAMEAEYRERVN